MDSGSSLRQRATRALRSAFAALSAIALITGVAAPGARAAARHARPPTQAAMPDDQLRLNQLQVIGTHNSYHLQAGKAESAIRGLLDPSGEKALEYTHPALATQLSSQQVRQLELDVWADPNGGLYAKPLLRTLTFGGAYDPIMKQPGTKVLHIQDIDYHSNCLTFRICLQAIKTWSDAHSAHVPLAVLVEFKDSPLSLTGAQTSSLRSSAARVAKQHAVQQVRTAERQATARRQVGSTTKRQDDATRRAETAARAAVSLAIGTTPLPWTTARMDTVDSDIRATFPANDLITPDDVRAGAPTLESAVLSHGWPTLAASRGKLLFLMDNAGTYRTSYLAGHPDLQGRVLFTNSTPGQPDAAFVEENDPTGANLARIQQEVRLGYVVRTRADVDTAQARSGDTTMRDAALASGAQWVSTDYPTTADSARFGTGYAVKLPGTTAAHCNPVNAPAACTTIATP